ncbi:MAG: alanine racemase [Gemmatimonadetes bacterium]|nr:MAG: alanine racemase [Gemmatimonadota bacterium]
MPSDLAAVETPALVVDLDRLDDNLTRVAEYAASHGLALRPHVKTHKSPYVAAAQLRLGAKGLTCATTREAEVMSEVSDDVLLAYPPVGRARARRLAAIPSPTRVIAALDSEQAASELARAARDARREIGVYVELDLGMHRVGTPTVDGAVALARHVSETDGLTFEGIAFYPGHIRQALPEQDDALESLDTALTRALERFHEAALPPRVVSGGSTPTLWRTHEVPGVTEIRPGTYVFNDRQTVATGACTWDDCALTVLATVVSTAIPGQVVIDAGTKALGREPMTDPAAGFGQLLDRPGVIVSRMSEEHGILDLGDSGWRPAVGDVVQVVPNHVCVAVHLQDVMYGVRGGRLERSWPIAARGRGQPSV